MEQEILIGASVAITVAVAVAVKIVFYKILNFKIDESSISSFLEGSDGDEAPLSTVAISAVTGIAVDRVAAVCGKSKTIERHGREKDYWSLKR